MRKSILKKAMCLAVSAFLLLPIALGSSYGAYVQTQQSASSPGNKAELDILEPEQWEGDEGVLRINSRYVDGESVLFASAADKLRDNTLSISRRFDEPLDLSAYSEIALVTAVGGTGDCNISMYLEGKNGTLTDTAEVRGGRRSTVYFALDDSVSESVSRIKITVSGINSRPSYCMLQTVFADTDYTYAYAERFFCRTISAIEGKAEYSPEGVTVKPEGGKAELEAVFLEPDGKCAYAVSLEINSTFAGLLETENTKIKKTLSTALYGGANTYTFILSELPERLRIRLSGAEAGESAAVAFTGFSVVPLGDDEGLNRLGTVSSCIYADGKVTVKGTLFGDAAVNYIDDGTLALYCVPLWASREDAFSGEPEAEMSISTKFEMSVVPKRDVAGCRYAVAVKSGDKVIPVSTPVFAMGISEAPAAAQKCFAGLYGAGTAAVFEASASAVVIDVYAGSLLETKDIYSARRVTYKEGYYYFNSSYIAGLKEKVDFCTSSGCKVYLRLLSGTEGCSFDFNTRDEGSISQLTVIASFLAQEFKNAAGFIALSGFAETGYVDSDAREASLLYGAFASAVRTVNSVSDVLCAANGENTSSAVMVSYFNKLYGINNASVMFDCYGDTVNISALKIAVENSALGGQVYKKPVVFWRLASESSAAMAFKEVYEKASLSGIAAVIMSPEGLADASVVYEAIKQQAVGGKIYKSQAYLSAMPYTGSSSLWDFKASYSTFGWLAGGACSAPGTAESSAGSGRVLCSDFTASGGENGVLVSWFDRKIDVSAAASGMLCRMRINSGGYGKYTVSVVLGSAAFRAEYTAEAEPNKDLEFYIDLTGYAALSQPEFAAIIINGDDNARLEISDISLCSTKYTDAELAAALEDQNGAAEHTPALYVSVIALAALTATVFFILRKHRNT